MPNEKPNGEDIFIREKIEYFVSLKMRSEVMRVLKENFTISERLIIEEKIADKEGGNN